MVQTVVGRQWRCTEHLPEVNYVPPPPAPDPTTLTLSPFGPCSCGGAGILRQSGSNNLLCHRCGFKDADLGVPEVDESEVEEREG
jgi:hypothetical protein